MRDTITGIICEVWKTLIISVGIRTLRRVRAEEDAGGGSGSGNIKSFSPEASIFVVHSGEPAAAILARSVWRQNQYLFRFTPPVRNSFMVALMIYSWDLVAEILGGKIQQAYFTSFVSAILGQVSQQAN